jgi:membrane protease YdiL (CAAX protease family)
LVEDRSVLPALCFAVVYYLFGLTGSRLGSGMYFSQWVGLVAALGATPVMMAIWDRRLLPLGLATRPGRAALEFLSGVLWAFVFALAVDTLIVLTGRLTRSFTGSFEPGELFLLLVPAALHEELVFRGYPFQKLLLTNRTFTVVFGSVVFMCAHMSNRGLTNVALLNIFLAGLVLSLAFLWRESLWVPIGIHLGWNVATGPILGHEISGFMTTGRIFTTFDDGPEIITGGNFGIEGSLWTTFATLIAIVLLLRLLKARSQKPEARKPELILNDHTCDL